MGTEPPVSIMMYAISGSTKTSQCYNLAKWIHKKTGKKIRMIHSDGGGYAPFVDSGMVEKGIVEVFDYSYREHALADLRRLSQGYWPRWVKDGKAFPNYVEGATEYFKSDNLCMTTPEEWKGIAGYIIEGMTSTGEALKNHCSNQTEGVGFKETWKYEEDGYTIVGLQQGHYDIVQKEIYARHMQGFRTLPIQWLVWTALLGKGEDKQQRETMYGPQVVGNASTPRVPTWFNHCFFLNQEKYKDIKSKLNPNATEQEVENFVAWFVRHNDTTTGVPYLAKTTVLPEIYPKLLECFPYGFVPLDYTKGIAKFFEVLEVLNKKKAE